MIGPTHKSALSFPRDVEVRTMSVVLVVSSKAQRWRGVYAAAGVVIFDPAYFRRYKKRGSRI